MNSIVYILINLIYFLRLTIAIDINYEETAFNYNNETLNILFCNSKSTKTLIAFMCPNIQKAFITTPAYYSLVLLKTMNIIKANEMLVLSDNYFNSIDNYEDMILISSNSYFYLFKSVNQFKKIKFPFDISLNTIVTQGKLFNHFISANVKQVNYPFTNYFYFLYFNYTTATDFTYISMDIMYQLPSILQLPLISYHVNYCYNFLNIPKSNRTPCLMISDYNIMNKGLSQDSNLYLFQLSASETSNIKLSIVKKVTVPYSCGYKIIFLKESILFSCPLLQGIGYCNKGNNCNINNIKINNIINGLSTAGYDMTLVYQDDTNQSNLVAIGDCYNGKIYLMDIYQSQFSGLSVNIINAFDSYNSIYYSNELFGFKYYNPFIEVMFIYDGSRIFIWNSNIKGDKYINSYQTNGEIDIRVFLKTILTIYYCNSKSYYDNNANRCVDCPIREVSTGFTSSNCNQCFASNDYIVGYYCPDYCSNKEYGPNCVSCEDFLKSIALSSDIDFANQLTYLNDDNSNCEFYCPKGKVATEKHCIDETVYANDHSILVPAINNVPKDQCVSLVHCYACYQHPDCSWCENTNLCMPTSSKRNCTISSLTFFSQYKCLSASDIKTYSNENSIGVILKSSDINNIDVSQMFVYYFSYTHYTKVKLSLTIHKNGVLTDLRYSDYLTGKITLIDPYLSTYSKVISIQGIYIMMTLPPSVVVNTQPHNLFNVITITIEVITKEFSKEAIIGIVFGSLAFITLVISVICLIQKQQSAKLKEITINQRIHNYNPIASMSNLQVNIPNIKAKVNTKQIKGIIKEIYKEEKVMNAFIKKELKKYPTFILDQSCLHLTYYTCSFCEKKFSLTNNLVLLDCNHIFHSVCIEQQLITNEKYCCLICSNPILSIPSDKLGAAINLSSTAISEKGIL